MPTRPESLSSFVAYVRVGVLWEDPKGDKPAKCIYIYVTYSRGGGANPEINPALKVA